MPGIGADIADPDVTESAYAETPLRPLASLVEDGLAPMADRYGELTCPLLLLTSPQDHVVDPGNGNFLAESYGGPVERDQPRAQLPRRHARLRQGPHLRRRGQLRPQGDGLRSAGRLAHRRPRFHPQPVERGDQARPAAAARLWADDRPRRPGRGVAGRPAARGPRCRTREDISSRGALGGARRGHRLPAVPRGHGLERFTRVTGSTPSRSGRAASASGAASVSASRSGSGPRCAGDPAAGSALGHHARRCRWPRPSAGGATGGTRSSSAGRPTCPGRWRSIAWQGQRRRVPGRHDLPPDVPLRVALVPGSCAALIWIDKRFRPWGTELFAMYVAGYTFVRFWIERIRVGPGHDRLGLADQRGRLVGRVRPGDPVPDRLDDPPSTAGARRRGWCRRGRG